MGGGEVTSGIRVTCHVVAFYVHSNLYVCVYMAVVMFSFAPPTSAFDLLPFSMPFFSCVHVFLNTALYPLGQE